MNDFLKKNKIYFLVATYSLVLVAVYFFTVNPLFSQIKNKNIEIQEKVANQESKKEKISKLPAFKSQFEKVKNNEEKIKIGADSNNMVLLLEKIEKISDETGNKVKIEIAEKGVKEKKQSSDSKDDSSKKEKAQITEKLPIDRYMTININLLGNYQNFVDFVRKLENLDYYSDIISIKISKESLKSFDSNPFESSGLESARKESEEVKDQISSVISVVFYLEK